MIVTQSVAERVFYKEDVNSTTGEAISTGPCVIYDVTFTNDTGGVITCTLHNATTASAATRLVKAVVAANSSVHYTYPRGKRFDTAIWAKPNAASLDIAIDYD
jgi:hypothetical protein